MSRALKILLGATLCLQAGVARSQGQGPATTLPPTDTPPPAPNPAAPDVNVPVRQRPSLTPAEMLTQARDYRERMEQIVRQVQTLVEQARQQKDVIKLNCLYDRLGQLRANVAIANAALQTMSETAARRDEGATAHEYTRMTIVHQKAQVLAGEAQACVGEDLSYVGQTRVDVDVTGVPPDDFTSPPPPVGDTGRPPAASPTE